MENEKAFETWLDREWPLWHNQIYSFASNSQFDLLRKLWNDLQQQQTLDTARIDWLDAHPRLSEIVVNGKAQTCYFYGVAGATGLKLREIIDAAMTVKRS